MHEADLEVGVRFDATLWLWDGAAAWHFVTLPQELSDAIEFRAAAHGTVRGFGSVRVEVEVGSTRWRTSLFPDTGRGAYLLPVKRSVRDAEGLVVGTDVSLTLRPVEEVAG